MDVSAGSTANGARVQLWDCNGTGAQQWTVTGAHDIVNPQANKCLDATGAASTDGTPLQIWDCTGGANQKWNAPSGGGGGGGGGAMAAPDYYNGRGQPPHNRAGLGAARLQQNTPAVIAPRRGRPPAV